MEKARVMVWVLRWTIDCRLMPIGTSCPVLRGRIILGSSEYVLIVGKMVGGDWSYAKKGREMDGAPLENCLEFWP